MANLLISEFDQAYLERLRLRASSHGHSLEIEAKLILEEVLQPAVANSWSKVEGIFNQLAASGRSFTDSAELLREDRER